MNTVRTVLQLLSLFLDNTIRLITPQMVRDFVVSCFGFSGSGSPGPNNDNADTAGVGAFFDVGSRWNDLTGGFVWQCLDGTPTAAVWVLLNGSGGPPSGAAGGDLSGTYPNPGVAKIQGVSISGTPSVGDSPIATGASTAVWGPPPAASISFVQAISGGTNNLGSAAGTWDSPFLSLTLPSAGTWLLTATVRGYLNVTLGTTPQINGRLIDVTNANAVIANSQALIVESNSLGLDAQATATWSIVYVAPGANQIGIGVKRDYATTFIASATLSDADGRTSLTALRLL